MHPPRVPRWLLPLLVLAVACLSGAAAAADVLAPPPSSDGSVVRHGCHRPAPTTAAGYQALFDGKNDATWAGGDQAATVALPGGRVLWLFADTVRGARNADGTRSPGSNLVHSSLLLQGGGCLTAIPSPQGAEAIPSTASGEWYWPKSAVVQGNELIVFASRVRRTGPGPADFTSTGVDAAVFSLASGLPVFERMAATPSSRTPESGAQYGEALVRDGGWLLTYSSRKVAGKLGKAVGLARVRPAQLLDPAAWQYWTGSSWSSRPAAARDEVTGTRDGWSTSFSVFRTRAGDLRMLAKEDDVFGHDLITGTTDSPTHPFTRTVLGQAASGQQPGELFYTALAHPELPLEHGFVLASICRNNTSLQRVWSDTNLYKPQFFVVAG
jgi:hypothetical protein